MKFSISRDFRHEFGKKPMLSRSMYEAYRWTHDGHTMDTGSYPMQSRTIHEVVSFAYDVDANGMRRLDDVVKPS